MYRWFVLTPDIEPWNRANQGRIVIHHLSCSTTMCFHYRVDHGKWNIVAHITNFISPLVLSVHLIKQYHGSKLTNQVNKHWFYLKWRHKTYWFLTNGGIVYKIGYLSFYIFSSFLLFQWIYFKIVFWVRLIYIYVPIHLLYYPIVLYDLVTL